MKDKNSQYINNLFHFDYNKGNHIGLCVALEDGKLICYRAKKKDVPKFSGEIPLVDGQGIKLGYVVDYRCKFRIPVGCARKRIICCDASAIEQVNKLNQSMTPLKDLVEQYKELKAQYYHTPGQNTKSVRHQLNEIAQEINARNADFLQQKPSPQNVTNKYSNFKKTPNRNGSSNMYSGGSCSGK